MTRDEQRAAPVAHLSVGAGVALAGLGTQSGRDRADTALEVAGLVPVAATDDAATEALARHVFFDA